MLHERVPTKKDVISQKQTLGKIGSYGNLCMRFSVVVPIGLIDNLISPLMV